MAKDKKSEKKRGSKKGTITCERTYVSDRCSRNGIQQDGRRSSSSPPNSPIALRVLDVPCRHHRRGAVREKRPVSLDKPRPAHQRVDNAYVETPFVDGAASIQMQQNWKQQQKQEQKQEQKQKKQRQKVAALFSSIIAENTEFTPSPVRLICNDCQPSCSTDLSAMKWSDEPPPRPGKGIIDEFPAYVPWKAELSEQLDSCVVCYKCRCSTCQMQCKHPGLRVGGKLDVRTLCDKEFIDATIARLPYLEKTPRCKSANAARARAANIGEKAPAKTTSAAAAPAKTASVETTTAEISFAKTAPVAKTATAETGIKETTSAATTPEKIVPAKTAIKETASIKTPSTEAAAAAKQGNGAHHNEDADSASSVKCRLCWLLCCLCSPCPPCHMADEPLECAAGCRGNFNVHGCKCVDWDGIKLNTRSNVNVNAAAVSESRDLRRWHQYYITALPKKKSIFRRMLCL